MGRGLQGTAGPPGPFALRPAPCPLLALFSLVESCSLLATFSELSHALAASSVEAGQEGAAHCSPPAQPWAAAPAALCPGGWPPCWRDPRGRISLQVTGCWAPGTPPLTLPLQAKGGSSSLLLNASRPPDAFPAPTSLCNPFSELNFLCLFYIL